MPNLVEITDTVSSSSLKVDLERGIIRGVKILGLQSDNGRRYLPEAVKDAARLYEGVKVNINHPKDADDPRLAEDRFGKLRNVRYVPNKGLYGDLEFLKSHPMAERICEAAERMPDAFGMSHNAQGDGEEQDGIFVVNKIVEVRHVDLVADPATTKSLSESRIVEGFDFKDAVYDVAKLIQKDRLFDAHRLLVQIGSKDISQQAKSLASKYSQEIKKLAYQQSKGARIDKATKDSLMFRLLNNLSQLTETDTQGRLQGNWVRDNDISQDEFEQIVKKLHNRVRITPQGSLVYAKIIHNGKTLLVGKWNPKARRGAAGEASYCKPPFDYPESIKESNDATKEGKMKEAEQSTYDELSSLVRYIDQTLKSLTKILADKQLGPKAKQMFTGMKQKIDQFKSSVEAGYLDLEEQEEDGLDDETLMDYEDGEMADESSVSSDEMEQDGEDDKNKMEQNEEDEMSEEDDYDMDKDDSQDMEEEDEDVEEGEYDSEDMKEQDEEELDDEDENGMYENKRRVSSRVRHLLQLCEQHQVRPTRATISDLARMPKAVARRTVRKLGLLERASKPRSSGHTFQNEKASGPSGVDLFNWLKD